MPPHRQRRNLELFPAHSQWKPTPLHGRLAHPMGRAVVPSEVGTLHAWPRSCHAAHLMPVQASTLWDSPRSLVSPAPLQAVDSCVSWGRWQWSQGLRWLGRVKNWADKKTSSCITAVRWVGHHPLPAHVCSLAAKIGAASSPGALGDGSALQP